MKVKQNSLERDAKRGGRRRTDVNSIPEHKSSGNYGQSTLTSEKSLKFALKVFTKKPFAKLLTTGNGKGGREGVEMLSALLAVSAVGILRFHRFSPPTKHTKVAVSEALEI